MILDLHSEGSASAGGASAVALSMTWGYSPRVRAIAASPELELTSMNSLAGDTYDFELWHRYFHSIFLSAGNI